jgi:hypothetical protein
MGTKKLCCESSYFLEVIFFCRLVTFIGRSILAISKHSRNYEATETSHFPELICIFIVDCHHDVLNLVLLNKEFD